MENLNLNLDMNKITPTIKLDTSDKLYLTLCSLIIIGMLFTATIKKSLI